VYLEGMAGPYRVLVVVRMPNMIPGVAGIEVRSLSDGLRSVRVTPMRIRGLGSDLEPVADVAEPSREDPRLFRAQLWLMLRGGWKVHVVADGDRGRGELSVPVAAVSVMTRPMQTALQTILSVLAFLLIAGAVAIVGASVREGSTAPGEVPAASTRRRARLAMIAAATVIGAALLVGDRWWRTAAADAEAIVYKPPQIAASLTPPARLEMSIDSSNTEPWAERRGLNELVEDHGHLVHVFLVHDPGMDFFVHLHPDRVDRTRFAQQLPSMPEGKYRVFADIVRGTGFPETETGIVTLPPIVSGLPAGDDALAAAPALIAGPQTDGVPLGLGARVFWMNPPDRLRAGEPLWLTFRVEDKAGRPAGDLEPYMGMAGHLIVVRADWRVFAHLHPAGSAPMAAVQLANGDGLATHGAHGAPPPEITFPYGFPDAGHYRLFLQVKRAGRVETAVFDAEVRCSSRRPEKTRRDCS
jgi:hypothetical protein